MPRRDVKSCIGIDSGCCQPMLSDRVPRRIFPICSIRLSIHDRAMPPALIRMSLVTPAAFCVSLAMTTVEGARTTVLEVEGDTLRKSVPSASLLRTSAGEQWRDQQELYLHSNSVLLPSQILIVFGNTTQSMSIVSMKTV